VIPPLDLTARKQNNSIGSLGTNSNVNDIETKWKETSILANLFNIEAKRTRFSPELKKIEAKRILLIPEITKIEAKRTMLFPKIMKIEVGCARFA
jgi:hypothetical protein